MCATQLTKKYDQTLKSQTGFQYELKPLTKPCSLHTFPFHAHGQALLVATVLAAIALAFVNQAFLVIPAGVAQVFAHSSLEKPFATLTAVHSIMFTCQ